MANKFKPKLNHFILYCKGWYRSVEEEIDSYELYRRVLSLDGYGFLKTKQDILRLLLMELDHYNEFLIKNNYKQLEFFRLIENTIHTQCFYNLSFEESIIKSIIEVFLYYADCEQIELSKPFYDRKLYKKGLKFSMLIGFPKNGMTYKEQNNFADKIFNNKNVK